MMVCDKHGRGVELGSTVKQLRLVVKAGLELGNSRVESGALANGLYF